MTDPDLWAEIVRGEMTGPKGRDLVHILSREGGLGRRARAARWEYRRWLYLDRLAPGQSPPFVMERIAALQRGDDCEEAPVARATDARLLALYAREFGQPAPQCFWPDTGRLRLMRRVGFVAFFGFGSAISAAVVDRFHPLPEALLVGLIGLACAAGWAWFLLAPAFLTRLGE